MRFSKACVKAKDVLIRLRLTRAEAKEKVKVKEYENGEEM